MFPVKKDNGFLPAVNHSFSGLNGLNGLFGRLARKLIGMAIKVMAQIPVMGPLLAEVAEGAIGQWTNNYQGDFWNAKSSVPTSGYEPTLSEESVLTLWFEAKFMPFFERISIELSRAFAQTNATAQIAAINKVMTKICVTKAYHKNNNTTALSKSAIEYRNALIDEVLLSLENMITTSMTKFPQGVRMVDVNASANTTAAEYSGMIALATFALNSYTCKNYVLTSADNGSVITPVVTMPATPDKPAVVVTVPVTANPDNTSATKPQNFLQKNLPLIGLGVLAAAAFWPKKKKSTKK